MRSASAALPGLKATGIPSNARKNEATCPARVRSRAGRKTSAITGSLTTTRRGRSPADAANRSRHQQSRAAARGQPGSVRGPSTTGTRAQRRQAVESAWILLPEGRSTHTAAFLKQGSYGTQDPDHPSDPACSAGTNGIRPFSKASRCTSTGARRISAVKPFTCNIHTSGFMAS